MYKEKDALKMVQNRIHKVLDKSQPKPTNIEVVVVWAGYILGNEKYLITTNLPDGKYYEVTYNKNSDEMYLDEYVKIHNEGRKCV